MAMYEGLTRPQLTEILVRDGYENINRAGFHAAWKAAGPPPPGPKEGGWEPVKRAWAFVPPDRSPFLPFNTRSGWELLAVLEPYGCKVRGWQVIDEGIIISECLAFMQTNKFKAAVV